MLGWFQKKIEKHKKKPTPVRSHPIQSPNVCPTSAPQKDSISPSPSVQSGMTKTIGCSSHARWIKQYDVCICHSQQDIDYVMQMVSYLEEQPEKFRCFLQLRDATPGGAVPTELCHAVRNSHCWVMLITQNFLQDPWCKYQMHQALVEAPITNGRTIPVVKNLDRACYPVELRFMYYINVTVDKESDFQQIKRAILHYLQDLDSNDMYISSSDSHSTCETTRGSDHHMSSETTRGSDHHMSSETTRGSDHHMSSESPCISNIHTNVSDSHPSRSSNTQTFIGDSHRSSERRSDSHPSSECTRSSDILTSRSN